MEDPHVTLLDQERCLARDALRMARTSWSLVILEAPSICRGWASSTSSALVRSFSGAGGCCSCSARTARAASSASAPSARRASSTTWSADPSLFFRLLGHRPRMCVGLVGSLLSGRGRLGGQRSRLGHLLVRVLDERLCVLGRSLGLGSRPLRLGVPLSGDLLDPLGDLLVCLLAFLVDQAIETLASLLGTPLDLLLPLAGRLTHAPLPVLAHGLGRVGELARVLRLGQRPSFCLFRPGDRRLGPLELDPHRIGTAGKLVGDRDRDPSQTVSGVVCSRLGGGGRRPERLRQQPRAVARQVSQPRRRMACHPSCGTDFGHTVFPRATRPLLICGAGSPLRDLQTRLPRFCEELCWLHPGVLLAYLGRSGALLCFSPWTWVPTESGTHCSGH